MEDNLASEDATSDNLKRPNPPSEDAAEPPNKKVRLKFSGKEFRKQLKNGPQTQVLQGFLQTIVAESKHNCILTYLEAGGSVTEILQLIDADPLLSPSIVFEVINHILWQINAKLPKFQNSAHESCHFLLNRYITIINKMLGLGSLTNERLICLKLLATMATFSLVLAKNILLHVNLNPSNLELLTKVNEGKTEVREAFIHFITAFLVGGHFPALSILLEKKGVMTSIVRGLQFDSANTVVLVLTAFKNNILENAAVSKTVKMKTFNTAVVRDIINLYNWKGPQGRESGKNKSTNVTVDELDKSKVNETVHAFLLVLCTSHKFGVIFKDPMIGLGKRQNALMYAVLDSLERPWEHSYAGDLVIKICKACPDLIKTTWTSMKQFLEPRWTTKWRKTIQFAARLLDELPPDCIEPSVSNLDITQVCQVIKTITAPVPVLKEIVPENCVFDQPAIKHQVLKLLVKMAESMLNYLNRSKTWTTVNYGVLSDSLSSRVNERFPGVDLILKDWDEIDEDSPISERLEVAFDLLDKYRVLCPNILNESSLSLDVKEFLLKIETVTESRPLQVKAVDFFLSLEPAMFKYDLFDSVLSLTLRHYYDSRDLLTLSVLNRLLKTTTVFAGFHDEIDLWIDGVLNLKSYDENVAVFLSDLIKKASAVEYSDTNITNFSAMLTCVDCTDSSKTVKNYLNFVVLGLCHLQTDLSAFGEIISKLTLISPELRDYVTGYMNGEVKTLKCKGRLLDLFRKFSVTFFENTPTNFDCTAYYNLKLNLLQTLIFYLTNLLSLGGLQDVHKTNCLKFLTDLGAEINDRYVRTILGNPVLLRHFNLFDSADFSTKFILKTVEQSEPAVIEKYLGEIRRKIVATILKMFRKSQKYEKSVSVDILKTVGLEYDQCCQVLEKFVSAIDNKQQQFVLCYCLDRINELATRNFGLNPLSNEVIKELSKFLSVLVDNQISGLHQLALSLHQYLTIFPHSIQSVEAEMFAKLIAMTEFNKDNLALCEFLLERKPECLSIFVDNLDVVCAKKSFLLSLLDVVVRGADDALLANIFTRFESHIVKALQKPHKVGSHFQNRYQSVGVLIEKFMSPGNFGRQIQKFETAELWHVYLLRKVFDKVDRDDSVVGNMIMTFVHVLIVLMKQKGNDKRVENFTEIARIFVEFLNGVEADDLGHLGSNEAFRMFCKLCLKHGVAGDFVLIDILTQLVRRCVAEEETKLIFEMMLSHSQFLDVMLSDTKKNELANLWLTICTKWPHFMERNHIPLVLASYRGLCEHAIILRLLKKYESEPKQTKFFDFKPFLWGRAAASHYSVRSDLDKVLWRQPKMVDVLNNLHYETIQATITNPTDPKSYDLDYFLPLFSHLLSPENPVPTYMFTKSGALALTLAGFRGGDKNRILATCHVLQRFYFHLEARRSGKDTVLWLRFIEAICKGVVLLDDFIVNDFVAVFLARTALVLAQSIDVMYVPLSKYLAAKDSPNFGTIPELYTFLHSSEVDYNHHKHFILEVIRDGLRNDADFGVLLRSKGFKLVSELGSSGVCGLTTKRLILEVFEACCRLEFAVKVLCEKLSFLTQVLGLVLRNMREGAILSKLLDILLRVVQLDENRQRNFIVYLHLITLSESKNNFQCVVDCKNLNVYYQILSIIVDRFPEFLREEQMMNLLEQSQDEFCKYLVRFGCSFVKDTDCISDSKQDHLRLLFYNKLKLKECL